MEIEYFIDPEEPRLRAPSFWAAETQKPVQISTQADFRQIQEEWIQEMWNFLKDKGQGPREGPRGLRSPVSLSLCFRLWASRSP